MQFQNAITIYFDWPSINSSIPNFNHDPFVNCYFTIKYEHIHTNEREKKKTLKSVLIFIVILFLYDIEKKNKHNNNH